MMGRCLHSCAARLLCLRKKSLSTLQEEGGATLPELLVAITLTAILTGVITTAVVQYILVSRWGYERLLVSSELQVATLWLGRDANEASYFTPGVGIVYGTLSWADTSNQYRYSYDSANTALIREHWQSGVLQSSLRVARRIANQPDVTFSVSGNVLTVTITATEGSVSNTITLELTMRSD